MGKHSPKRSEHSARAAQYQNLYWEVIAGSDTLTSFHNEDGLYRRLNPFSYNEDIIELEEELRIEFWRLVEESMGEKQKFVLKGIAAGRTQEEIAESLGIHQSSVAKALGTECSVKRVVGEDGKVTLQKSGSKFKLRLLIDSDPAIQQILARIAAIREESWW